MPNDKSDTTYINSLDFKTLEDRMRDLFCVMKTDTANNKISRALRYVDIDVEQERSNGKLQPDELLIPSHLIDSNIRREQAAYVQFDTQSNRACVMQDLLEPSVDTTLIEKDFTNRVRFDGWQLPRFSNIDGMQQNGYGVLELVMDQSKAGEQAFEYVQKGDFGILSDTKDVQESEMTMRNYYFTKTKLMTMVSDQSWQFDSGQVKKVIDQKPNADSTDTGTSKDKSLYRIQKVMFRCQGIVHVAWTCNEYVDNWMRAPRPLYLGRVNSNQPANPIEKMMSMLTGPKPPTQVFETNYPYFIYPYLISENNTISELKGRVYLDQDCQQAVMSIVSSFVTGLRRASGLYFSKDVEDPNDDILLQKNVYFKQGALINGKVKSFQLTAPPSETLAAINLLVSSNQQETSQVNFAANNRKDSRKTAEEIKSSERAGQSLSTVQVVLYSNASKQMFETMFSILQSRINAGLIQVSENVKQAYSRRYIIKPAGDTDVIERNQLIMAMVQAWPIMQTTPAAVTFLCDMLSKMFPDTAAKYCQIIQQADTQAKSAQAQQQQVMMKQAGMLAQGISSLAKKPEMFSDTGKIHVLPALEAAAEQIDTMTGNSQQ